MKKPMKRILLLLTVVFIAGATFSCKEEGPHKENIVKFTATINSSQTVPKVSAQGQGIGTFEYNKTTRELSYNITYQNVTATSISVHRGIPAWAAGDRVFYITETPTGGQAQGKKTLTIEEQRELFAGELYVNIPTKINWYGEIRGQILANKEEY